jgi:diguanylate cyclase (GGDEF)-like protein/PAS domain S-box-containing protein
MASDMTARLFTGLTLAGSALSCHATAHGGIAAPLGHAAAPLALASLVLVFAAIITSEKKHRRTTEKLLRDSEDRFRALVEQAPEAILVFDVKSRRFVDANSIAERLFGCSRAALLDGAAQRFYAAHQPSGPAHMNSWANHVRRALGGRNVAVECAVRTADGRDILCDVRLVRFPSAQRSMLRVSIIDITARMAAQEEANRLAFFDTLTGLPNRRLLEDRLQQALVARTRGRKEGAVLLIDLDNFKHLNESFGRDNGDLVLQQVAQRLRQCVREADTVARMGGNEFVIILEGLNENLIDAAKSAIDISDKIFSALAEPYQLGQDDYVGSVSIGVALIDMECDCAEHLLRHAEFAMYQAKDSGRNTMRLFDPALQARVTARSALEGDLRKGIARKEFVLYYQPQVNERGLLTGAEVLIRWRHPQRGLVPPGEFIALAEDTGLIIPIGLWVLDAACTQLAAWAQHPATRHLTLAVNVSARQFQHPDFARQVLAALERSGAAPASLKLELTESLLLHDIEGIIAKMTLLKAHGVGFSLDDFGIGYSSLSYLKRLPLDQLKIDQSFVRDVFSDANDAVITRAIVALGRSLGLQVIAEGVETIEQRNFLADQGCNAYQGYLFSRPVPLDEFELYVDSPEMALMVL